MFSFNAKIKLVISKWFPQVPTNLAEHSKIAFASLKS